MKYVLSGSCIFQFLVILSLLFPTITAQAQWNWLNPTPQGNDLHVVTIDSQKTLWAGGLTGTIMQSDNGGTNWEIKNLASRTKFTRFIGLHWPDDSTGFAVDRYGYIYRSRDAGSTWDSIYYELDEYLYASCFPDAMHGFVVGSDGKIIRTDDGGDTWIPFYYTEPVDLMGTCFTSAQTGYAIGSYGYILKTTNGGNSWNTIYTDSSIYFQKVAFTSADTGFVVGDHGVVMKTTNGGLSWASQQLSDSTTFLSISCFSHDTLIINGRKDSLMGMYRVPVRYRSTNNGTTWARLPLPPDSWITEDIAAISGGTAYTVGEWGRIEKTTDYGNTWTFLTNWMVTPTSWGASIRGIDFPTNQTGYAVVDQGEVSVGHILKTTDGGTSWQMLDTSSTYLGFRAVDFVNENLGCVGGSSIYSTFDGGQTWILRMAGLVFHGVNSIDHTSNGVFVAVGNYGSFLRSTDFGQSWYYVTGVPNLHYKAVCFADNLNGFAAGDNTLLKTTDAGATWSVVMQGTYINAIDFVTPDKGIATGYNGLILMTNDGGTTWTPNNYPTTNNLFAVSFYDADTAYAVGGIEDISAIILKTTDGGLTWQKQFVPMIHPLYTVAVTGSTAFTGGLWCYMFGTTNGGIQVNTEPLLNPQNSQIILYPNPADKTISITDKQDQSQETTIAAYTLEGILCFSEKVLGRQHYNLDVSTWRPGTYLLHIRTGASSQVKKIVVF